MKYISCIFLKEGITEKEKSPIEGVEYHTLASALEYVGGYLEKGISDFLVFGSTQNKSIDFACTNGLIREFIKTAKNKFGSKVTIYADVGLPPYAADGQSVVIVDGSVDEGKTYELASKLAVAFAEAGVDYIAPCLPLSNQIEVFRKALDSHGYQKTKMMPYSAKFSSALYGPYFATIQSPLKNTGKKANFHTDYSNADKALSQILIDEKGGADMVMVKPSMIYLDVVYRARQMTKLPLSVYHVSGEYSMMKEGCKTGLLDENEIFDELHSGFKRCGVDYVIGYAPDHFLRWLQN